MNAPRSFIRATMAPASLAAAIGMAFAMSAPAQAQYRYPGTAGSSGHYASSIHPIRAGARERAGYGALPGRPEPSEPGEPGVHGHSLQSGNASGAMYRDPTRFDGAHVRAAQVARPVPAHRPQRAMATMNGGYGNPSMQRGEACPPGSNCAAPTSGRQESNGGGPAPSAGYGGQERYGHVGRAADSVQPAQASGSASISPVRAGAEHSAMNHGPSQTSNANFYNSVTGKTNGPTTNPTGQPTSFNGPNGKVGMGGPQSFTGPNGKSQTIGGGPDLNNIGGGYGHQKGSAIKQGMSYSVDANGSMSGTRTGSAPGMASAGGMNMGNGGESGVSDGSSSKSTWQKAKDAASAFLGIGASDSSTPDAGSRRHVTPNGGPVDRNAGPDGIDRKSGVKVAVDPPKKGDKDTADMGPDAGPGEIVNGAGNVVTPGKHKGQDDGNGPGQDSSSSKSGGQNAQGHYIAPSGQDAPIKPKEQGVLRMDYNGKNGVTDPKLNGSNGGGG